ncbi:carbon-nitrogen hydrolase [Amycolatopsis rubida]|uniref:Carbon-nitrogen hydrolase n=1 Tax=Amycolatopsis rubida TaxID=112413 RepID=A0A1I5ZFU9_9PSEU|nr:MULTISPECIES: nitrilase-related carbon-nitrogen hydrolase [Amycolatopsis]MYW92986.1 carbon-nitrogen hydrolase [Amycolatopsis rubida]NEC57973.1 carbon-nitrogen hydrolase [Amycolatopsis rubida]OAP25511.1 (R)-stereoselective amidase [Amycolatopsis sp. M39]SFQ55399.1 Predicted amidohydrolase [Amycolatopsis rubida]
MGQLPIRVVLAQLQPVPASVPRNIAAVAHTLASFPEADLAVFPELFLSGYGLDYVRDVALDLGSEELAAICALAARYSTATVLGFPEAGAGIYNSLLCVDRDGRVAGVHRKTHLFGRERAVFRPDDEVAAVELAGLRIAPMTCFEVEFPEVARTLARQEPDLFVAVAANMDPYGPEHRIAIRARALENRTPLVYVNRTGVEDGLRFTGESCTVGANGAVLHSLGGAAQVISVDVSLNRSAPAEVDYRRHLRPELYHG